MKNPAISATAAAAAKMAEVFTTESATDAVEKYPELAHVVAAVAAMNKKAEMDDLTFEQRAIVAAHICQNVSHSIKHGKIPKIK